MRSLCGGAYPSGIADLVHSTDGSIRGWTVLQKFLTLLWAYVQKVIGDAGQERAMISVDLDEGMHVNWGIPFSSRRGKLMANMGYNQAAAKWLPGGCKENYLALREIEPNEELLLHYSNFATRDGWKEFGLKLA